MTGPVLTRPSARLMPDAVRLETVVESTTTVRPAPAPADDLGSSRGPWTGSSGHGSDRAPQGGTPRRDPGDEAATEDSAAETDVLDADAPAIDDAAFAPAPGIAATLPSRVDVLDAVPPEAVVLSADDPLLAAVEAEAGPSPAVVPGADLRGYVAYGENANAGVALSRDELVTRYAHLVKYVVGRLGVSVPGLFDHEDAMQAGVLGLLRAIDAYRPDAAASFESYAILRIRGSILDAVRSLDTVGRAGREAARAIQGAIRDLQHELGRSPSETEIAARLNIPVTRYRERLQAASVVTISLDEHDARDTDDESFVLADNAADPNAVDPAEEASRRDAIAGLIHEIGRLGERPKMVLALYYQDEMTFKEIGQVLGVTESRVCQIHTEAILALRGRLVDSDVAARLGRRRGRQ
jgi:RNA polymerase sigma factor for flagellar operon FliA